MPWKPTRFINKDSSFLSSHRDRARTIKTNYTDIKIPQEIPTKEANGNTILNVSSKVEDPAENFAPRNKWIYSSYNSSKSDLNPTSYNAPVQGVPSSLYSYTPLETDSNANQSYDFPTNPNVSDSDDISYYGQTPSIIASDKDKINFVSNYHSTLSHLMEDFREENFKISLKNNNSSNQTTARDWNEEFLKAALKIKRSPTWSIEVAMSSEVLSINKQFFDTASTYAKIIISELAYKDVKHKTIKPSSIGGIAGGEKFFHSNILFKLGLDTQLSEKFWMYGGRNGPNHPGAMKALKRETFNSSHLFSLTGEYNIHLPLMTNVDYLGYRIVAIAILPINKQTIVYGSNDGGVTVHNSDPEAAQIITSLGQKLNWGPHIIKGKEIYGPGDIEIHRGTDGRLYLIDVARIGFPEDPRCRGDWNDRALFYNFLRMEETAKQPLPLCQDSFTLWDKDDPQSENHQKDISFISNNIIENRCLQVAQELDEIAKTTHWKEIFEPSSSWSNFWEHLFDFLPNYYHRKGINLRNLGYIRIHSTDKNVQKVLLTLMMSRCLKDMIGHSLRVKMRSVSVPSPEPFKLLICQLLNDALWKNSEFWKHSKSLIQSKFIVGLTENESNLYDFVDITILLTLAIESIHLNLNYDCKTQLLQRQITLFSIYDIHGIEAHQDKSYLAFLSEGMQTLFNFQQEGIRKELQPLQGHISFKIRSFKEAQDKFNSIIKAAPFCPIGWGMLSYAKSELAAFGTIEKKEQLELFQKAFETWEASISMHPWFLLLHRGYLNYLEICSKIFPETKEENMKKFQEISEKLLYLEKEGVDYLPEHWRLFAQSIRSFIKIERGNDFLSFSCQSQKF